MSLDQWIALLAPALAGLLVVSGGVWAYQWQKDIDRKTSLMELRRVAYQDLISELQRAMLNEKLPEEKHIDFLSLQTKALLFASKDVILALRKVFEAGKAYGLAKKQNQVPDEEAEVKAFAELVKAMREDCFEGKSEFTLNEYQKLVPFD